MKTIISSLLWLWLLNLVNASMYSHNNNRHSENLCGSSINNGSCDPDGKNSNCRIPAIYKSLFIERNRINFDEVDGSNVDENCCCPTNMHFLDAPDELTNTNNKRKKLAYANCKKLSQILRVGTCNRKFDTCGKCKEIYRKQSVLIEENGKLAFDQFELASHCSCVA